MERMPRRHFLSLLSALFATACGGGGGPSQQAAATSATQAPATGNSPPQPPQQPQPPAVPVTPSRNVIERENAKGEADGVTSDWQIAGSDYASNGEIEGYASATSVGRGESIRLYVNTPEPSYSITVYRIGWYGGKGGRRVAGPVQRTGVRQPAPVTDPATRLVECRWQDPYVIAIPDNRDDATDWASGVYLAKLTAGSSGKQSYIVFTVRDDARNAALLFQCGVTTYAAYNNWGGYDFYDSDSRDRTPAYKLSFDRPYRNPQRPWNGKGAGDFLTWEIMMVRFLEREGYDVAYATDIDTDARPESLRRHRAVLSVGHDEYWTKGMRDAFEAARDGGVHLGFFGANACYWQVRLEPGADGTPNRTVVCYKYDAAAHDPLYASQPVLATGLWRRSREGRPARPEASLIGVMYDHNPVSGDIVVTDAAHWICAGTDLQNGAALKGLLGYEADRVDASSPGNVDIIARSPYRVGTETRHAHVTWYTAPGGAGVFATGSMQWNWGLDDYGEAHGRVNPAVQRMTANVLARFLKH